MEKLSWTELRKAIAQRIGTDEKEVSVFMNALIPAITKALREDRQVKITNLGTFKLQTVAARKSVNVATGEAFMLPEYDKLSFTPESSVKELLGNAGAVPVPNDPNATPLRKLGEQASEIVDILGDLGQSPKPEVVEEKPEPIVEEPAPKPVVEDPTPEPVVEEPAPEPEVEEPAPTPVVETPSYTVQNHVETNTYMEEKKERKPGRTWLIVSLTVLIFALLLAAAFLFAGKQFIAWVEGLHNKNVQDTTVVQPVNETIVIEETPQSTLPYPCEYTEFIAQERLPKGSRLAWLARKYYGERELWVFIYEANRDHVEHPSLILKGTLIKVPKLPDELRDMSNPELQALVERLATEYKKL